MIAFFYLSVTFFITLNILNDGLNLFSVLFAALAVLLGGFLSLNAFRSFWHDDVEQKSDNDVRNVFTTTKPVSDIWSEEAKTESYVGSEDLTASDPNPFRYLIKIISLAEIPLFLYFWVSAVVSGGFWGVISGIISGGILTFVSLLSVYLGLLVGVPFVLLTEISVSDSFLYVRLWWAFINSLNLWFANIWDETSPSIQAIWIGAF